MDDSLYYSRRAGMAGPVKKVKRKQENETMNRREKHAAMKNRNRKSQRAYINRCNKRGFKPHMFESHNGGQVTAVYGDWVCNQRGSLVAKMVAPVLSDGDFRETIGALGSDGKEYLYVDGYTIDDRGPKPQRRSRQRLLAVPGQTANS